MKNIEWRKQASLALPNLEIAIVDGREVGMIDKPRDSRSGKNAWRCYKGIGEGAKFLGHAWTKAGAKQCVATNA